MTEPGDRSDHAYTARLASAIEARWQERWEREHTFCRRTPPARWRPASHG
jgi:leucyl-tRNA synthetase